MLTGPPPKFHGTRDILSQWVIPTQSFQSLISRLFRDGSQIVLPTFESLLNVSARSRRCNREAEPLPTQSDQPIYGPSGSP
jgi:hypothetical protein